MEVHYHIMEVLYYIKEVHFYIMEVHYNITEVHFYIMEVHYCTKKVQENDANKSPLLHCFAELSWPLNDNGHDFTTR